MATAKQDTIHVYRRVTEIIWGRLSPTFGIRTINAIAKNALARSVKAHPALAHLKVTSEGLDWSELEAHQDELSEDDIATALEAMMDEFFEAIATLIGRLVINKIFVEAEQEIKKGEHE